MVDETPIETFRPLPLNLEIRDGELFNRSSRFRVSLPKLIALKRVFIFWQGQLFKSGKIVPESLCTSLFLKKYSAWFFLICLVKSLLKGNFRVLKKPQYLIVHDEWSDNYFHWLTDVLTRLYTIKDIAHKYTFILPDSFNHPYQLYTLKKFNIKNIRWINSRNIFFAGEVLFPAHTAPADNPELLRNAIRFLTKNQYIPLNKGEKIYISRQKAACRKVINEAEVISFLQKEGFAILFCEELSFEEQVSIFAHARVLVSIHGAGLTNLVFMPAGGSILELRKQDNSEKYNCYFTLSHAFGQRYFYQGCESDTDLSVSQADIYINIEKLQSNLALML